MPISITSVTVAPTNSLISGDFDVTAVFSTVPEHAYVTVGDAAVVMTLDGTTGTAKFNGWDVGVVASEPVIVLAYTGSDAASDTGSTVDVIAT